MEASGTKMGAATGKGFLPMQLHALLRQFDPQLSLVGIPNVEITGVAEDSRRVLPGPPRVFTFPLFVLLS